MSISESINKQIQRIKKSKQIAYRNCYSPGVNTEIRNILIAGGTGMIGENLALFLKNRNYNVFILTRSNHISNSNEFHWNPERNIIDPLVFQQADAIINLAGANVGEKRWTQKRKRVIVKSRTCSTKLLFESLQKYPNKVQLIINASAIGIYGDTKDKIISEEAQPAADFLAKTCHRWEQSARQFETLNIRTVILRIGLVLSKKGGLLQQLLTPLRFGIAPVLGTGEQYQSWVHIDDLCNMVDHTITRSAMQGVYNAVSPEPVTNKNFMLLLAQIFGRKYISITVPTFILRMLLGEKSILATTGTRATPNKIINGGFVFKYPKAAQALRNLLGK